MFFTELLVSILLNKSLGVELLGDMVISYLTFRGIVKLFSPFSISFVTIC